MQPYYRKIIQVSAWVLITLISVSCDKASTSKSKANLDYSVNYRASNGGTLIDAMTGEPSGLIAMIAGESAASAIAGNIFNSLLKYDKNLELTGELAESWEVSSDQRTITFHLKPNLKWADNEALTSDDVLFTWQKVTDEKTRTPYGSDFKLVTKAEIPDINTFR